MGVRWFHRQQTFPISLRINCKCFFPSEGKLNSFLEYWTIKVSYFSKNSNGSVSILNNYVFQKLCITFLEQHDKIIICLLSAAANKSSHRIVNSRRPSWSAWHNIGTSGFLYNLNVVKLHFSYYYYQLILSIYIHLNLHPTLSQSIQTLSWYDEPMLFVTHGYAL